MSKVNRRSALRLSSGVLGAGLLGTIPTPVAADPNARDGSSAQGSPDRPVWHAKDYGVVADGGADHLPAINSLISTAATAGGGIVLLPPGTMKVSGSVEMASNVTLRGHGWTSVLRLTTNIDDCGVIQFGAVANISIEDLKIEGDGARLHARNIGILGKIPGGYSNVEVRNVWIDAVDFIGIAIFGSENRSSATEDIRILDCRVSNTGGHGVIAQWGVDRCRIERCVVSGYGQTRSDCPGITAGRFAYDSRVIDNRVNGAGALGSSPHGISLDGVFGGAVCARNSVADTVGFGIEIGMISDGTFVENSVTNSQRTGIMLTSIGAADDRSYASNLGINVSRNTIDVTAAGGIGFYMGSAAPSQDCPASGFIARRTAYTESATVRVVDGRRLYECMESGVSAEIKPLEWGSTALGETVTDGTTVWIDRGITNSGITLTGNVVRNTAGHGLELSYVQDVTVAGNNISQCGLSGISVLATANIFTLSGNQIDSCNTLANREDARIPPEKSGITITAFSNAPHVARMVGNKVRDGGIELIATDAITGARLDDRFLVNCASPTVAFGSRFDTRNNVPTDIARFMDPNSDGSRLIVVKVKDKCTTFKHSAAGPNALWLVNAVDYAAPLGTTVDFMWEPVSGRWVEVVRNDSAIRRGLDLSGQSS